jgi:hypothetical protein|tara:strand:+ start:245 stop:517 length:273 start_codon:yes stop_codon:yes gene_type:complete
MKKQTKRVVDDYLPKWLSSEILSAVGFIYEINKDENLALSLKRIQEVHEKIGSDKMKFVMALLCLDKVCEIVQDSKEFAKYQAKKERTVH